MLGRLHWELALWYYRIVQASRSPLAVLEALYHACRSAECSLEYDVGDNRSTACSRLDWASTVLRLHQFVIQTIGYSRGSCRKLQYIRSRLCPRCIAASKKEIAARRDRKEIANAVVRLQVGCTEVMRAIAREVGEVAKAYERHKEIRMYFVSNDLEHGAKANEKALAERCLAPAFPFNGAIEWVRWWKWNGMLGMASRSYDRALRALLRAIECAGHRDPVSDGASLVSVSKGESRASRSRDKRVLAYLQKMPGTASGGRGVLWSKLFA